MDFAKLTRYDATFRSDSLRIDSYELELDLGEATTSPTFPVEVGVKLTSKSEQIFLDYLGESVESVTINGNPVPWEQRGDALFLTCRRGWWGGRSRSMCARTVGIRAVGRGCTGSPTHRTATPTYTPIPNPPMRAGFFRALISRILRHNVPYG